MSPSVVFLAAALCHWASLSPAHAMTTYYVSVTTGDDATTEGTQIAPWRTITRALSAANLLAPGEPVDILVAAGTYYENLTIRKDHVDLQGGYDPATWAPTLPASATVINAQLRTSGITVAAGLSSFVLRNVTIINGLESNGGGINSKSDLWLYSCVIRNCKAAGNGGALYIDAGKQVQLSGCVLQNNSADGSGGGIYGKSSLEGCTLLGNAAQTNGGGLCGSGTAVDTTFTGNTAKSASGSGGGAYGSFDLTRCIMNSNFAMWRGSGVYNDSSDYGSLTDCAILGNGTSFYGGGVYGNYVATHCTISYNEAFYGGGAYGSFSATDCLISRNHAKQSGGGVCGFVSLTRCNVSGNTASQNGGGVDSGGVIADCWVTNNSAGPQGGGISGSCTVSGTRVIGNRAGSGYIGGIYGSTSQITNCIIWDNPGGGVALQSGFVKHCSICNNPRGTSPCGTGIYLYGAGATAANNVVAGHEKNIFEATTGDPAAVKNNLLAQPLICQYWVNGAAPLNTEAEINNLIYCQNNLVRPDPLFVGAAAGDLHLQAGSPCIDAGSATDSSPTDFDKNARPFGAAPDIGAFEWGYALPPHWPSGLQPAEGATGVAVNPVLQWSAAARATSYDLYVWPIYGLMPQTPTVAGVTQTTCTLSLPGGWGYAWMVAARNAAGEARSVVQTFWTRVPAAPSLQSVADIGDATAQLAWLPPADPPAQFLGFAWDIYQANWVQRFSGASMWQPFADKDTSGTMGLGFSGAYHVWISSQYPDGYWTACQNPWTGIIYSGTPHTPLNVTVENRGGLDVRLHWKPEIYGTWHDQIIAYKVGDDFVSTAGPSGDQLWHFVDYGGLAYDTSKANFLNGWADFTLPSAGDYWLLIRGVGWLPPYPAGEYGTAFVSVP
ncbi:MAG: DUF1565 domain-containing protein [Candidatus Sumerlaeota bacterium]|nr:DUF1565 domain-containing protein [Candidatus Sumerlaeota bacterium]